MLLKAAEDTMQTAAAAPKTSPLVDWLWLTLLLALPTVAVGQLVGLFGR